MIVCLTMIACKQNSVSFTYSPEAPRAGQSVRFNNLSTTGEEWLWTFGDGTTSSIKSPSHTYKQPGTYQVILKVDNKNAWTATEQVTVYDTVPTFVANDSVFYIYQDYTFTANVYNPYNYEISYEWMFPINTPYVEIVNPTDVRGSTITLCFTKALDKALIGLKMVINGETTLVEKEFMVRDTVSHSVLMRTSDNDYRQRIFGARAEEYKTDASAKDLLDAAQDTAQTYNGHLFTLSELQSTFSGIKGFHIANRKLYYRADGLWVAAIDGSNRVQIDSKNCSAMVLDKIDSRIYWANEDGVWYMPMIGSDNNQFVTEPIKLNTLQPVTKIAVDEVKR